VKIGWVVAGAVGLLGGVVIGRAEPAGEVVELQQEVFDLRKELAQQNRSRALFDLIASDAASSASAPSSSPGEASASEAQVPPMKASADADEPPRATSPSEEEDPEAIDGLLGLRQDLALNALYDEAGANAEEEEATRVIVDRMNDRLEQVLLDHLPTEGELSRRDIYVLMEGVLGEMNHAEEQILALYEQAGITDLPEEVTDPLSLMDGARMKDILEQVE